MRRFIKWLFSGHPVRTSHPMVLSPVFQQAARRASRSRLYLR